MKLKIAMQNNTISTLIFLTKIKVAKFIKIFISIKQSKI